MTIAPVVQHSVKLNSDYSRGTTTGAFKHDFRHRREAKGERVLLVSIQLISLTGRQHGANLNRIWQWK